MPDNSKNISGMTRREAEKVVLDIRQLDFKRAVDIFLACVNGQSVEPDPSPLTPSDAIPVYKKPNKKKRHQKPGREKS